ncbi:ABC transporter permease, partial [Bowmanella denitrificans]|uniref:ABC transporter permease n=1 Tax=Bowmanella denitrificans TaxID=366582 RepID=UPI0031CE70DC
FANDNARLLVAELENQPGIQAVAISQLPPFKGISSHVGWVTPEHKPVGVGHSGEALTSTVTPGLFKLLETPIIKGQDLIWENPFQVVVNRTLWEQSLAQYSLGEAKLLDKFDDGQYRPFQVVGVVEDSYFQGPDTPLQPMVYTPTWVLVGWECLLIQSQLEAAQVRELVVQAISKVEVGLKVDKVESLAELARQENAPRLAILAISLSSALITLLAALVFTFNSTAQMAQKGARELALRSCLGARPVGLIGRELGGFLLVLVPVFVLCLLAMQFVKQSMQGQLPLLVQPPMLLLAAGLFIVLSCLAVAWHIRRQLQQNWLYLS